MKYVSVCAGIEAATVAWHSFGWEPALFSEIEPFPCAVLKHHYPNVPLIGDFTQMLPTVDGPATIPPPKADLLVGGTPCQAFSVAGKRLSLEDYRGNLSLAFADLYHAGNYQWAVWENVPGVLSTRDNAFGCLLGRLVGADGPLPSDPKRGWPRAGMVAGPLAVASWRVLDAQFFGVAQRRQRVFVLVSRGAGNWAAAAALLPVGVGLSGDSAPRREARQDAPTDAPAGARGGGAVSLALRGRDGGATAELGDEIGFALRASTGGGDKPHVLAPIAFQQNSRSEVRLMGDDGSVVGAIASEPGAQQQNYVVAPTDIVPALTGSGRGTERTGESRGQDPIVLHAPIISPALKQRDHKGPSSDGDGDGAPLIVQAVTGDVTHALTLAANTNDQTIFAPVAFHNRQDPDISGEITHPLGAKDNGMGVMAAQCNGTNVSDPEEVTGTLRSGNGNETGGVPFTVSLRPRRLTPRECERLQGFPDDYTLIPWRKGVAPDGPRYKALGNSMCVDVMHWLGERIALVEKVWHLNLPVDFEALGLGEPDQLSLL